MPKFNVTGVCTVHADGKVDASDRYEAAALFRAHFPDHDVTVVELADDMIAGQFITRILRHATPICPPYYSTATLREIDGQWRAVSVTTGLSNRSWPFTVPTVEDDGSELNAPGPGPKEE